MFIDFLIMLCIFTLFFGWVLNIIKAFDESENSNIRVLRIIFTFLMPIIASVIGFMNFPKENKVTKVVKKVQTNNKIKSGKGKSKIRK